MRNLVFLTLAVLMQMLQPAFGQDQCIESLTEAEERYRAGKLYEIPEILSSCLESGFTKEQKIRAYRLLTLTNLYLNYYERADQSYLSLLRLSPEYSVSEGDPQEIINHHLKFTTDPIFYIMPAKFGMNLSYANVLTDYSLSNSSADGASNYSSVLGVNFSLGAEMVIHKRLRLAAELLLSNKRMHLNDRHWDFYSTNLDIVRSEIEIPISLRYYFLDGKIRPFVLAGVSPSLLVESSVRNIQGTYSATLEGNEEEGEFPVQPRPEISTTRLSRSTNYALQLGGGMYYKIGLNFLTFEVRYGMGMQNVTRSKERWREDFDEGRDLKFPTGHVDDDYTINNLSFSLGYVMPIYKPRKIK